jgi:hypothetical protein
MMSRRRPTPVLDFETGLDPSLAPLAGGVRTCRECGCGADHACYQLDRGVCGWAEKDLCTHCVPRVEARRWRRRFCIAIGIFAGLWALCIADALYDAQVHAGEVEHAVTYMQAA